MKQQVATEHKSELSSDSPAERTQMLSGTQLFLKATGLSLIITAVLLLITAVVIAAFAATTFSTFLKTAGVSYSEFSQQISVGLKSTKYGESSSIVFLLLGLDTLDSRPGSPALSDTIMYVVLNKNTGVVTTIAIPRDLWSPEFKTKVNALYHYGKERYPERPEQFPTEVLDELTGLKTTHTVVITMDLVAEIIDTLGGIDVAVPVAFTDTEFPRSNVDVTKVTDPALLYETVSFSAGTELMNGQRALQYMRSRKSEDDQGTDTARNVRQQLVVESLVTRLRSSKVLSSPKIMGNLYGLYAKKIAGSVSVSDAVALGKILYPLKDSLTIQSHPLSIFPESPEGLLVNPPITKYKQWVYEVRDIDTFKQAFTTIESTK